MLKDNDKVVFVGGYMTEINWGAMKCILSVEVQATNKILRRAIDRLSLLGGPLEIKRGMYDLSPATDFNREVERRPQDGKIFNRRSPRFFQGFDLA